MSKSMTLKPRVSEKAYGLSLNSNVYVLQVPSDANKMTVAEAVSAQFGVTVTNVNIAVAKGKLKTTYRKRGGRTSGSRSDVKKAYVTLKSGDSIAVFASEEDQKTEKPAEKSKKAPRSTK
jgi:large subunit ribosomal protein L23